MFTKVGTAVAAATAVLFLTGAVARGATAPPPYHDVELSAGARKVVQMLDGGKVDGAEHLLSRLEPTDAAEPVLRARMLMQRHGICSVMSYFEDPVLIDQKLAQPVEHVQRLLKTSLDLDGENMGPFVADMLLRAVTLEMQKERPSLYIDDRVAFSLTGTPIPGSSPFTDPGKLPYVLFSTKSIDAIFPANGLPRPVLQQVIIAIGGSQSGFELPGPWFALISPDGGYVNARVLAPWLPELEKARDAYLSNAQYKSATLVDLYCEAPRQVLAGKRQAELDQPLLVDAVLRRAWEHASGVRAADQRFHADQLLVALVNAFDSKGSRSHLRTILADGGRYDGAKVVAWLKENASPELVKVAFDHLGLPL